MHFYKIGKSFRQASKSNIFDETLHFYPQHCLIIYF